MIGRENAPISSRSSFAYDADDTITPAEPARIPATNGSRYGSVAVVVASTARVDVSVLARTRPNPGKCLTTVSTPASWAAGTTVATASATRPGSEPYWRWNAPIGGFASPIAAGTVSATGA